MNKLKLIKKCLPLLLILCLIWAAGCEQSAPSLTAKEFVDHYKSSAPSLGFDQDITLIEEEESFGFLAFDGIFTVCCTADGNDVIEFVTISTTSDFAQTIEDEGDFNQALIWAAYLALPFYLDAHEYDSDDISTLAGILLASFDGQISLERGICSSKRLEKGFEITIICP